MSSISISISILYKPINLARLKKKCFIVWVVELCPLQHTGVCGLFDEMVRAGFYFFITFIEWPFTVWVCVSNEIQI